MVLKLAIDARKFLSAAKFSRSIFIFLLPGGPRAGSLIPPPLAGGWVRWTGPGGVELIIGGARIYFAKNPEGVSGVYWFHGVCDLASFAAVA
jgi:hypothetical protein